MSSIFKGPIKAKDNPYVKKDKALKKNCDKFYYKVNFENTRFRVVSIIAMIGDCHWRDLDYEFISIKYALDPCFEIWFKDNISLFYSIVSLLLLFPLRLRFSR